MQNIADAGRRMILEKHTSEVHAEHILEAITAIKNCICGKIYSRKTGIIKMRNVKNNENNMINILVKVEKDYVQHLLVTLVSLFENNPTRMHIFCLCDCKKSEIEGELNSVVQKYGNVLSVFELSELNLDGVMLQSKFLEKCYYILMAHKILPQSVERILYLKHDVIIHGNITEFYQTNFDDKYLLVRGQTYKKVGDEYHKIGARPEKGQWFDARVLLLNISKFRKEFVLQDKLNNLKYVDHNIVLTDQGILNVLFASEVKYASAIKYNFRFSIYEEYIRHEQDVHFETPIIICYEQRDYYKIGIPSVPWKLMFCEDEIQNLKRCGIIREDYDLRKADPINYGLQELWWEYAKKIPQYRILVEEFSQEKEIILARIEEKKSQLCGYQKVRNELVKLGGNIAAVDEELFSKIKYRELERYIDSIDKESAIKIMKTLFRRNAFKLATKKIIQVAFLVYSSSEWQCEELYRLFEQDDRFEPFIVVTMYEHGSKEDMRRAYLNTCEFFGNNERHYEIRYLQYNENEQDAEFVSLDDYDILIYFTPFSLFPDKINILERTINQLCIHIPYGYYLEDKNDAYYQNSYYDAPIFKLSWFYFASCNMQKDIVCTQQRLMGYNVQVSGFPKVDTLIQHHFIQRQNLWKINDMTKLKVIWAPHFNLANGMNGTFHENYSWFYEFARKHTEISWIVRPHPRMEWGVIEFGVFKTSNEYKQYLERWNHLPNARVVEWGDYYDIFDTSDTMILDSLSFLAEYQFTEKPLLLLQPENVRALSKLGEKLVAVLYKTRGNDFKKIEKFLDDAINNVDPQKDLRKSFKDKYLNYMLFNKKTATKYIFDVMANEIYGNSELYNYGRQNCHIM